MRARPISALKWVRDLVGASSRRAVVVKNCERWVVILFGRISVNFVDLREHTVRLLELDSVWRGLGSTDSVIRVRDGID